MAARTGSSIKQQKGTAETGLAGRRLGTYQLHEQIGWGGMAAVYRAVQQPLGRVVALKVLSPALAYEPGLLPRFVHEARTVARLDHPNILPVFDYGRDGSLTFLAMPLVTGGTLRDRLRRGRLHPSEVWRLLVQIGDGLQHAHDAGVVHRDLKPNNVLMHADGRPLLSDFGLARSAPGPSEHSAHGIAIGTAGYMAPEQATGQEIDHRADIHALGVMAFEMLTGRAPWKGATQVEVVVASVTKPMPSVRELVPSLPAELDEALARLTAKDPADRPGSVREALRVLAGRPDAASRTTPANLRALTVAPAPGGTTDPNPPPTPPSAPSPAPVLALPVTYPPAPERSIETVTRTPAVVLSRLGLRPLRAERKHFSGTYWAIQVRAARAIAGDGWEQVARAAGLPEYLERDPEPGMELEASVGLPSRLAEGFEVVYGLAAPEALRRWGALVTEQWFAARGQRSLRFVPGGTRKVAAILKDVTAALDEVRGEHLHVARQIDEGQHWVVHHSNLTALGRRRGHPSCQYWLAAYEVALRHTGLLNSWIVEELECGSVTGSYDCLFAIRARRAAIEALATLG